MPLVRKRWVKKYRILEGKPVEIFYKGKLKSAVGKLYFAGINHVGHKVITVVKPNGVFWVDDWENFEIKERE